MTYDDQMRTAGRKVETATRLLSDTLQAWARSNASVSYAHEAALRFSHLQAAQRAYQQAVEEAHGAAEAVSARTRSATTGHRTGREPHAEETPAPEILRSITQMSASSDKPVKAKQGRKSRTSTQHNGDGPH